MSAPDSSRVTAPVVDRLLDAINGHDLEQLTACFAPAFSMVWPAHPARSFTGPDGVRRTWEGIFQAYPDIHAEMITSTERGQEIWGEWEFKGNGGDGGAPFWQRGVIIVVVDRDVVVESRFYMEPVEAPND